ncbi:ribokinase [Bacillus sp. REN3]|uniref:ribokinase n=1 Tax=Bacillus sp. REN3 TaxID=2802440 RepID=UPI001AEE1E8A|nr:ribokinase [Bacillus sp. REN3]
MMAKRITVIGSINMDLVTQTDIVPKMGETVIGNRFFTIPGGKGANQAVAAAKMGADVKMVGLVGDDVFGQEYLQHLQKYEIDVSDVKPVTHEKTGVATIILAEGENSIIVVPGANDHLTPEVVAGYEDVIAASDLVLLQLEIPMESVELAAGLAKKHKKKVILNPAPFKPLSGTLIENADYITPNEYEAELLLQSAANQDLIKKKLIITRGAEGVDFFDEGESIHQDSFKVEVVDTTGAGDTFNGALAVALLEDRPLSEACEIAAAAGALSVTKLGAQSGMPTRAEVESFLQQRKGEEA